MALNIVRGRKWLADFDFRRLFTDADGLGWERLKDQPFSIEVEGRTVDCEPVAQKYGFAVWLCRPADGGAVPDYPTRRKVEQRIRKLYHEHFVIFVDRTQTEQKWLWVRREPGRPAVGREYSLAKGQVGEFLLRRLDDLAVELEDDEKGLTVIDIVARVRKGLDRDKVSKKFYDGFKDEHAKFLKFLKGIPDDGLKRWYASVMLNRLMFIYFIQKKRFLGGDLDYLNNKLGESKTRAKDRYYRDFLCPLFFEGFAKKESERSARTRSLLGDVPYLNGGIFLPHQIEQVHGKTIEIADKAFAELFAFFDEWRWTLDERPLKEEREINPDVLGYIFEKYINQKQMGAYYTKEDITEYIGRNTIVPRLLDIARQKCRVAFEGDGSVWRYLQQNPDRYIFEPVRRGVIQPDGSVLLESELPDFVQAVMHDPKKRMLEKRYNLGDAELLDKDGSSLTLPTETWREYVARRQRCLELRDRLAGGEVKDVNDLITYNLDIRQFAQDVVEDADPDLLRAIWRGLNGMSVLDPTCGSGAFLFAALNILQPMYEGCLNRMQALVDDLDRSGEKHSPKKYEDFRQALARVAEHPNERYFILKSIVVNNLYGVDIMEEAVEICKLRLFLKLVAQVDDVAQVEPLPDIDFNIRCGNTLVGYATEAQVKAAFEPPGARQQARFAYGEDQDAIASIRLKLEDLQQAFDVFRKRQLETETTQAVSEREKREVVRRRDALNSELNIHLARQFGVDSRKPVAYGAWLKSHQPFHWFVEFYGIVKAGGFDVVLGNPPYVQMASIRDYAVLGFASGDCPDIYACCVERALRLLGRVGRFAMILPISFQFSADFAPLRQLCQEVLGAVWTSTFSRNPSALFSAGLGVRSTICVAVADHTTRFALRASRLIRWTEPLRGTLFQCIEYTDVPECLMRFGWPRVDGPGLARLLAELVGRGFRLAHPNAPGAHELRFKSIALYYISVFDRDPPSWSARGKPIQQTGVSALRFATSDIRDASIAIALGKLSVIWWSSTGDDFHVTASGLGSTPMQADRLAPECVRELLDLACKMKSLMAKNILYTKYAGKWMGNYDIKYVRHLTDEADRLVLESLGLGAHWEDIELAHARFMKMTGERPGTTREVPDFE